MWSMVRGSEGSEVRSVLTGIRKAAERWDRSSPMPLLYPFVMTAKEKAVFDREVGHASAYLEFGLGGSTLRALQKSSARIVSVESSPGWLKTMRRYRAVRKAEASRLLIVPVDIGPTRAWGYPQGIAHAPKFSAYSSAVFERVDTSDVGVVLVDGRFRVACTLKFILTRTDRRAARIMIHDFWNRRHYHSLLRHLDVLDGTDSLGTFAIRPDVDLERVAADHRRFEQDPR